MKILIDIDKETYKEFTNKNEYILSDSVTRMVEALQNGIIVEEEKDITKITHGDIIKAKYPNYNWWITEDNEVYTDLKDEEIAVELRDVLKDSTHKRIYFDLNWWNKKIIDEKLEKADKIMHHISLTDDEIEIFQAYIEDAKVDIAFGNSDWNEVYDKIVDSNWNEYAKERRRYYQELI